MKLSTEESVEVFRHTEVKASGSKTIRIDDVKDFEKMTKPLKAGDTVLLSIRRDGNMFFVAFKVRN